MPFAPFDKGLCANPVYASPYGKGRWCAPLPASPYGKEGYHGVTEGIRRSESGGREEMTVFFCILETATYNPSVSYADSSLCTREPWLGCGGAPTNHASPYGKEGYHGVTHSYLPYGKGRCHGVTEGIRRSKRRGQGCGERFIKAPERGKIPH